MNNKDKAQNLKPFIVPNPNKPLYNFYSIF